MLTDLCRPTTEFLAAHCPAHISVLHFDFSVSCRLPHTCQMLTNQWISGVYYVKSDGRMAVSQWVDNSRYYVGADGVWIP